MDRGTVYPSVIYNLEKKRVNDWSKGTQDRQCKQTYDRMGINTI